jgi:SOS-response transcriptional repressor LexA
MVRGSASMAASTDGVSDTVALALGTATAVPGLQAVRPRGRSMADAFVTERDVVLVQSTDEVHDGELVALRRGSGSPIQLRRIAFEGDHVVLTAEDRRVHPSILPLSQLRLCGRVVAIVRSGPATEPLAGPLRGG